AMGCIVADFRHDYTQTYIARSLDLSLSQVQKLFRTLERKALLQMEQEGLPPERVVLMRSFDMRYVGQGYELEVAVPPGPISKQSIPEVEASFRAAYRKAYGYEPEDPTEIVTFRVVAVGTLPELEVPPQPLSGKDASHAFKCFRDVYFDGRY